MSFTLCWKAIVGFIMPGTSAFEAVTDYLLERGNKIISSLPTAKKAQIESISASAKKVYDFLVKYAGWCPLPWKPQYDATVAAFNSVLVAVADLKITKAEIANVVGKWTEAYKAWMSDEDEESSEKVAAE